MRSSYTFHEGTIFDSFHHWLNNCSEVFFVHLLLYTLLKIFMLTLDVYRSRRSYQILEVPLVQVHEHALGEEMLTWMPASRPARLMSGIKINGFKTSIVVFLLFIKII